jgi:hypothetical protein
MSTVTAPNKQEDAADKDCITNRAALVQQMFSLATPNPSPPAATARVNY